MLQIEYRDLKLYEIFRLDEKQFIEASYQILLGREGDEDGISFYLDRLQRGITRTNIFMDLLYSKESRFRQNQIDLPIGNESLLKDIEILDKCQRKKRIPIIGFFFKLSEAINSISKIMEDFNALKDNLKSIDNKLTVALKALEEIDTIKNKLNLIETKLIGSANEEKGSTQALKSIINEKEAKAEIFPKIPQTSIKVVNGKIVNSESLDQLVIGKPSLDPFQRYFNGERNV